MCYVCFSVAVQNVTLIECGHVICDMLFYFFCKDPMTIGSVRRKKRMEFSWFLKEPNELLVCWLAFALNCYNFYYAHIMHIFEYIPRNPLCLANPTDLFLYELVCVCELEKASERKLPFLSYGNELINIRIGFGVFICVIWF